MQSIHILCVGFVLLTDAATGSTGRGNPGQTQGASSEVSVGEDIRQTELGVVSLTVKVEEVAHINVVDTELVLGFGLAVRAVEDLNPVDLEGVSCVSVPASTELCVSVDTIDSLHMLSDDGEDLLLCLGVSPLLLSDMVPQQWICLNEQ